MLERSRLSPPSITFKRCLPEPVGSGTYRVLAVVALGNGLCRVFQYKRGLAPDAYLEFLNSVREAGNINPTYWLERPGRHLLTNYGG